MNFARLYWLSILIFAFIHTQQIIIAFQFNIPFYITFLVVIGIIYFIQKYIPTRIHELGNLGNGSIYSIQIILLLLYVWLGSEVGVVIPLVIFIILEVLRHRLSLRVNTYQQLLETQAVEMNDLNETFLVVRKERHDYLKHISALHYMLEKNQHQEAKKYLNQLVEGYKETNLSIQGERGTVAGILHQSYQEGKEFGIEVIYDLETAISNFPLSDADITVLIGNILDNALNASKSYLEATGEATHITLQAYKRSGLYILNCKNDTLPLPNEVLDHLFTRHAQTTKPGKHEGLGTQIIADMVEKYKGHLDFTYKNNTFTLHLKLPAIKEGGEAR